MSRLPANSYLKLLQSGILTQRGTTHIQAEAKGHHSSYTLSRRFRSRFTREVTNGKLLEVYSVSADALGDYFLWLAPRSPSKLTGADAGPTAWPGGNGEGRRKGVLLPFSPGAGARPTPRAISKQVEFLLHLPFLQPFPTHLGFSP